MILLLLLLLLGSVVEACNRRIAVAVDVSGSISVDPVTGKQRPGPAEIRVALKKTMEQYLFRDAGACVGIYRFATNASLVFDYAPVALADTRTRLLAAVETLPFEMSYPGYFTNWEAAISLVADDQAHGKPKANWVYLVTDSSPTYSSDGQEHGSVDLHVRAAVRASKLLQKQHGTGVVGVGMGPEVKDAHLAAISGPCGSLGCFKGEDFFFDDGASLSFGLETPRWNYFHVDSISRANIPLGQSIQDRFLSVPALDEHAVMKRLREEEQPARTTTTAAPTLSDHRTEAPHFVTQPPAHLRVRHPVHVAATAASTVTLPRHKPVITRADIERQKRAENLSGGAIVGIVTGCILGFAILVIVFWLFLRWWMGEESALSGPSSDTKQQYRMGAVTTGRLPPPVFRV